MRPNLLFLFTDEQRADTCRAYGNRRIQTPHLDRLAAESVVFDRAYVTQPVCTPSRSSILTGLWPHTSGCTENNVPLDEAVPTLAERLPKGVWETGYFGKWHLGDEIFAQHGFRHWRSIEDGYRGYYRKRHDREARSSYHHWLVGHGFAPAGGTAFTRDEAARLPEPYSKPAYLAEEASRFLRDHRHGPWVLYVNFLEPHMPFYGPRDDQYDPSVVDLPGNFDRPPTEDQPLKTRLFHRAYHEKGHGSFELRTERDWRRVIAHYWGLVSLVDTHVGTILAALAATGQDERTVVVYTSDHGDMMGSHRLLAKCVQFEEAVRVPLMIRLPGKRDRRRVAAPVSQIDLVPTLLDLLGESETEGLEGASLRPVLEGAEEPGRDVVVEWNGPNSGITGDALGEPNLPDYLAEVCSMEEAEEAVRDPVRTLIAPDGWKLNWSPRGDHELYDISRDALETEDRVARGEHRGRVADMVARLKTWQARTGDAVALPEA